MAGYTQGDPIKIVPFCSVIVMKHATARATTGKEAANKLFKYFEFHISDKHIFGTLLLWQDLFATDTTHHQGVAHCLWK